MAILYRSSVPAGLLLSVGDAASEVHLHCMAGRCRLRKIRVGGTTQPPGFDMLKSRRRSEYFSSRITLGAIADLKNAASA